MRSSKVPAKMIRASSHVWSSAQGESVRRVSVRPGQHVPGFGLLSCGAAAGGTLMRWRRGEFGTSIPTTLMPPFGCGTTRRPAAGGSAFSLSDLIAAVRSHEPAVVAVAGEELAGAAVAAVGGDRAWVMRISLAPAWRQRGIGGAMLRELERRLVVAGVHRIQCLLAAGGDVGALALEHAGYTAHRGLVLYGRLEPVGPGSAGVLGQLGGRMVRADAWEQLGGMVKEKELIERRVILPLAQPQLAERLGLVPPRAIVLFGPPGTGKTSFARGAASRLGWPFVSCSLPAWRRSPQMAWPQRCGRRLPWSLSWTRLWCSSTRWRRSPGPARHARCLRRWG